MDDKARIKKALTIRRVEEKLLTLFSEGKLFGTIHTCIGEEWCGVAVIDSLSEGDVVFSNHRGHGHYIAKTGDINGLIAEIMGKSTGVCGGIGGSQHIYADSFYSNGIQGGMMPVSAGRSFAMKLNNSQNICVAFIGDGTFGEGIIYETMNIASKWGLPLLIVVENNKIAQSTSIDQTLSGSIKDRAAAFGIEYAKSNTWQWEKLIDDAKSSIGYVRRNQSPALLEVETFRLKAHSKGDDNRDEAYVKKHEEKDPLNIIIGGNDPDVKKWLKEIDEAINKAVDLAEKAQVPDILDEDPHISSDDIKWTKLDFRENRIVNIINNTFKQLFEKHPNMVLIGEDIEDIYGGAFKVSRDLSTMFPGRVRNTPISEASITGIGTGLALGGYLPIVEIMFGDFLSLCFDQIINHAAKFHRMYNKQVNVPLVIRTPMGGKRGYGPTHSQSIEKYFLGIPGLKMIALNIRVSPELIYNRIYETIENPVLVIENKILYTRYLKTNDIVGYTVQFSDELFPTVKICPENNKPDITIFCYGGILDEVEEVVEKIFYEEEILCEVICPSLINPINIMPVVESVSVTKKILIVEEGPSISSLSSEVLAQLSEQGVQLDKVKRLGYNSIIPSSGILEMKVLPNKETITNALIEINNE
ncbi:MAG: hypothetical protein JXB49_24310 [Bacteroidales bacterium]|nr:hypothetical protein [Bacteroidales bacterium]